MPKISIPGKKILDLAGSALGLIILSPLFLVIAIMIKLDSRGPVIYRQKRVGKDGNIFVLYKFRTMIQRAEEDIPVWSKRGDRRITRIGNILRPRNLDELPQLFNILKGEMSLVGPRPERPYFVKEFSEKFPDYPRRLKVEPGITGWAQVNGLYGDTPIEKRLEYDLYYIENFSFLFDLGILWRTVNLWRF